MAEMGFGGIEISKIRHLGPKRCGFGALEVCFKKTQGTTQNDIVLDKLK